MEEFSSQVDILELMLIAIYKKKQTLRIKKCVVLEIYDLR